MGGKLIPASQPVTHTNFHTIENNLRNILPAGFRFFVIGSAGKKEISSDLDVLLDAAYVMQHFSTTNILQARTLLTEYLKSQNLTALKNGVSVHVGIPNGDGISQVDLMIVEHAADVAPLHTHDYSNDPEMKGGTLHAMWADLLKQVRPDLKISPYRGLVDRATDELISSSKDDIARVIISNTASATDLRSVSALLSAIKEYPEKYQLISSKYINEETCNRSVLSAH